MPDEVLAPVVVDAITRIHLEPGDVLAVHVPGTMRADTAARLREVVRHTVPGHEVLVVTGVTFEAVNAE